jgi:hypothetical protein
MMLFFRQNHRNASRSLQIPRSGLFFNMSDESVCLTTIHLQLEALCATPDELAKKAQVRIA